MRSLIRSFVVLAVAGVSLAAFAQPAPSIQGVWRVTEVVATGANPSTNSTPQPGLYIFTKQHYSIVTVNGTSPRTEPPAPKDPANPTDAEKLARYEAWNRFSANTGTYTISGSTVTTKAMVAKNPGVMQGEGRAREFKITGKTLTLIEKAPAGQTGERRTTLTRLE